MEHAPPDCQYGHKEIAAFTDLGAVGPDPLDELAGTHHADGRWSALGSSVNVARLDHRKKRAPETTVRVQYAVCADNVRARNTS